ncbi:aldehyde dehydrogenase family protein [Arthrobacter globiformis]|uniref:aldehyde dehydrogenase family protein n=1 Tax=Arthrobacter globiformis TaxID=1665 RepID=UPI002794D24E|nr:aldehyde dehydrogenase family protein [Arthrobacter globiformis]MDQ0618426.1 acyl-CoA reductase-like NAD-dependent aldehyde dehydrogenase [Arthrobacter globiformis]
MTSTVSETAATFAGQDTTLQYIGGTWRAGRSERSLTVTNPYDDSELTTIRLANSTDVDEAYKAAEAAQKEWASFTPAARRDVILRAAQILEERREEIVSWLIKEAGSSVAKANVEVSLAAGITLEAASFPTRVHGRIVESNTPGKEIRVYRRPIGVVGVISPWNFPLHLSQRSVAPALALGNAVVVKPASDTPVSGGLILAKVFEEAGLPPGVLNVVIGAGSEIGDDFVTHPVPGLISFTGSTPVGQNVGRLAIGGKYLKHAALELGGNSPLIVLADADLDAAVEAAVLGKFLHQGQICMAVNRIIVEAPLYDEFVARFTAAASSVPAGDPSDPNTLVGPVINDSQLNGLKAKIDRALAEGARAVLDGEIKGRIVPPHVFVDVTPDMEIAREEIFGPLVGVLKADDEAHALELANASDFGLAAALFTQDVDKGVRFSLGIKSGMTHINEMPIQDEAHVAFGGERNSGLGRFNGDWAIAEFTTDYTLGIKRL